MAIEKDLFSSNNFQSTILRTVFKEGCDRNTGEK